MLRGQHAESHPENGVGPRGEHLERQVRVGHLDPEPGAFGAADPVALHGPHPVRPLFELLQVGEQPIGVVGDPEEPLRQVLPLDDRPATLAGPVDHLLVGEHGLVLGAPVDRSFLLVGETPIPQLEEQPLVPAVVVGMMRGQLAVPVVHRSQLLDLPGHGDDLGLGVLPGVAPGLMAAFSAGRPKLSHPIGDNTLKPRIVLYLVSRSPNV